MGDPVYETVSIVGGIPARITNEGHHLLNITAPFVE